MTREREAGMAVWGEIYAALSLQGRVLVILAVAIFLLVLLALLFSAYVVWLRGRSIVRARKLDRLRGSWNHEVLKVLEGGSPDHLLGQVEPRDRVWFLDFLLEYARLLKGPEREAIDRLAAPFLPVIFPQLHNSDPFRRMRAVQVLGFLGLQDHGPRVAEALDDESVLVAMVAARALARQGHPRHLPRILRNLDRFENWSGSYLTGLLASFGPQSSPALRSYLQEGGVPAGVRAVVADALADLHDLESADVAAGILEGGVQGWLMTPTSPKGEESEGIYEAVEGGVHLEISLLYLLSDLGRPEHLSVAHPRLAHPHEAIRGAAVRAVATLGGPADLPRIREALGDPSPWVALKAARGLKVMGERAELEAMARSSGPMARLAQQVLREAG
ncbi:MAG: HEAT repeat domain-containing protein [Gemmatimonadota bacterium]